MKGGGRVTEFEKIYRDYFDDVFLYIKRLSGSEDIADDITSEAFYKAMRSIKGFRGPRLAVSDSKKLLLYLSQKSCSDG